MSRLARFAALALDPLIPELGDLSELPLYFGSMAGEYATGIAFLHTLFQKGPSGASPLAFQNSVHNAPAAHISMVYGMKGAVETISSGLSTPTAVLERAAVAVQVHRRPALVVCAEEYGPEVQKGLHLAELHGVFEEGACAMLLARGTGG